MTMTQRAVFQSPARKWTISLWIAQILLAILFGYAGVIKSLLPIPDLAAMLLWPGDLPFWFVRFIGVVEFAGALGMILPAATRILPGLTPLAALGFVVIQCLAIPFHAFRGELAMALPINLVLLLLSLFVLWGRWKKEPITPGARHRKRSARFGPAVFQRLAQTDRAHFDFNRETTMLARSFIGMFVMLGLSTFPGPASATEFPGTDIAGIHEEIRAFAKVPISVRDAIAIAEKRNASAKVVDISFDGRSDQPAYRVKVHQNDEIWSGVIDAGTGTIIGDGDVSPVSALGVDDKAELAGLNKVAIDLSRAVAIAEGHGLGKAISAGLDEIGNALVFRVVVVIDGLLEMITINPAAVSEK